MLSSSKVEQIVRHSTEIDILDFKRGIPDMLDKENLAELVRDIIAIANSAYNGSEVNGYLVFGVEDKTRDPSSIRGQILLLKSRDRKPKGNPPSQLDIDSHNQRKFLKIVKDHISGTREGIRL